MESTKETLLLYPQSKDGLPAYLVGTEEALRSLMAAIASALTDGAATMDKFDGDDNNPEVQIYRVSANTAARMVRPHMCREGLPLSEWLPETAIHPVFLWRRDPTC